MVKISDSTRSSNGRVPGRTHYHIVYCEFSNEHGISFSPPGSKPRWGPGTCPACSNVVHSFKNRLDNFQTSLRMCVDATGLRFRDDVIDFLCLSPRMSIRYNLHSFQQYTTLKRGLHLTEETVIGTAMQVHHGEADPSICGISVTEFANSEFRNDDNPYLAYLHNYILDIRKAAEAISGYSVGLMLDKHGIDVSSFGVAAPMFAHAPDPPIREVVILVGGPKGIDEFKVLPGILRIFNDSDNTGLHLGTTRVRLPGGLQHSYVALGDLLNFHDRGYLLPILEDFRHLGPEEYRRWYKEMRDALEKLATSTHSFNAKKEILIGFITALSDVRSAKSGEGDVDSSSAPTSLKRKIDSFGAHSSTEVRSADVEQRLLELQRQGVLPTRRGWRVRMSLQALQPDKILKEIERLGQIAMTDMWAGKPLDDPWDMLADFIDDATQKDMALSDHTALSSHGKRSAPKLPGSFTQRDVAKQLKWTRVRWGVDMEGDASAGSEFAKEVRYLGLLPCSKAISLLRDKARLNERPERGLVGEVELALAASSKPQHLNELRRLTTDRSSKRELAPWKKKEEQPRERKAPWWNAKNYRGSRSRSRSRSQSGQREQNEWNSNSQSGQREQNEWHSNGWNDGPKTPKPPSRPPSPPKDELRIPKPPSRPPSPSRGSKTSTDTAERRIPKPPSRPPSPSRGSKTSNDAAELRIPKPPSRPPSPIRTAISTATSHPPPPPLSSKASPLKTSAHPPSPTKAPSPKPPTAPPPPSLLELPKASFQSPSPTQSIAESSLQEATAKVSSSAVPRKNFDAFGNDAKASKASSSAISRENFNAFGNDAKASRPSRMLAPTVPGTPAEAAAAAAIEAKARPGMSARAPKSAAKAENSHSQGSESSKAMPSPPSRPPSSVAKADHPQSQVMELPKAPFHSLPPPPPPPQPAAKPQQAVPKPPHHPPSEAVPKPPQHPPPKEIVQAVLIETTTVTVPKSAPQSGERSNRNTFDEVKAQNATKRRPQFTEQGFEKGESDRLTDVDTQDEKVPKQGAWLKPKISPKWLKPKVSPKSDDAHTAKRVDSSVERSSAPSSEIVKPGEDVQPGRYQLIHNGTVLVEANLKIGSDRRATLKKGSFVDVLETSWVDHFVRAKLSHPEGFITLYMFNKTTPEKSHWWAKKVPESTAPSQRTNAQFGGSTPSKPLSQNFAKADSVPQEVGEKRYNSSWESWDSETGRHDASTSLNESSNWSSRSHPSREVAERHHSSSSNSWHSEATEENRNCELDGPRVVKPPPKAGKPKATEDHLERSSAEAHPKQAPIERLVKPKAPIERPVKPKAPIERPVKPKAPVKLLKSKVPIERPVRPKATQNKLERSPADAEQKQALESQHAKAPPKVAFPKGKEQKQYVAKTPPQVELPEKVAMDDIDSQEQWTYDSWDDEPQQALNGAESSAKSSEGTQEAHRQTDTQATDSWGSQDEQFAVTTTPTPSEDIKLLDGMCSAQEITLEAANALKNAPLDQRKPILNELLGLQDLQPDESGFRKSKSTWIMEKLGSSGHHERGDHVTGLGGTDRPNGHPGPHGPAQEHSWQQGAEHTQSWQQGVEQTQSWQQGVEQSQWQQGVEQSQSWQREASGSGIASMEHQPELPEPAYAGQWPTSANSSPGHDSQTGRWYPGAIAATGQQPHPELGCSAPREFWNPENSGDASTSTIYQTTPAPELHRSPAMDSWNSAAPGSTVASTGHQESAPTGQWYPEESTSTFASTGHQAHPATTSTQQWQAGVASQQWQSAVPDTVAHEPPLAVPGTVASQQWQAGVPVTVAHEQPLAPLWQSKAFGTGVSAGYQPPPAPTAAQAWQSGVPGTVAPQPWLDGATGYQPSPACTATQPWQAQAGTGYQPPPASTTQAWQVGMPETVPSFAPTELLHHEAPGTVISNASAPTATWNGGGFSQPSGTSDSWQHESLAQWNSTPIDSLLNLQPNSATNWQQNADWQQNTNWATTAVTGATNVSMDMRQESQEATQRKRQLPQPLRSQPPKMQRQTPPCP